VLVFRFGYSVFVFRLGYSVFVFRLGYSVFVFRFGHSVCLLYKFGILHWKIFRKYKLVYAIHKDYNGN
jgi:hypothetical protein